MDYSEISYEERGPIRIIRFDRPELRNCIGPVTHVELVDAWTRFKEDAGALVAIITGRGDKSFCAGGDLKAGYEAERIEEYYPVERHEAGEMPGVLGPSRWTDIYKPSIAAVDGTA